VPALRLRSCSRALPAPTPSDDEPASAKTRLNGARGGHRELATFNGAPFSRETGRILARKAKEAVSSRLDTITYVFAMQITARGG